MKHVCTVDDINCPDCVFDEGCGPTEDCTVACQLQCEGKGKADCPHWRHIPDPKNPEIDWEAKYREAVKLANEALDLVEPAFDAGVNGEHGVEQSEAREAIRTQLEALEKSA